MRAGLRWSGCGSLAAVTEDPWTIRRAAAGDVTFMTDMLMEAVNWSPEWKKKSRKYILSSPRTAHYIAGWPRDGDLGAIAEAQGERIAAAWLRFLPANDPGYGFVASDVPELTIGVAAPWRGQGAGRALLQFVAGQARAAGTRQISLSVERKNFAQKLYLSEGFRIVDSSDKDSDTMVKDLAQRAHR
jgi:GNAT superfamily N-acetyltransferase